MKRAHFLTPLRSSLIARVAMTPPSQYTDASCLIYDCDVSTDTAQFWLPLTSSGSLIGDGNGNDVKAFSRSCADLSCASSSLSTLDGVLCKVCTSTRKVSVKLLCDGCVVDYSATLSKLAMSYSLDPFNYFLKTEVTADAKVNVKLGVSAGVELSVTSSQWMDIIKDFRIPIPWGGLTIGGITIGVQASFSLGGQADLDFQGAATVSARTALVANMRAGIAFNSKAASAPSNGGFTPTLTYSEPPSVSVSAAARVGMEIMLRPAIKIAVAHVAYAVLSADTFLRVDGSFQYPPFPVLSSPYQLPSPMPASLNNVGSCTAPHLVRYGVTAGVRNVALAPTIDINIGSAIDNVLKSLDYKYVFTPIVLLQLRQEQIVSGCLLPLGAAEPGVDQTLQLRSPTALGDVERSALAFNLAMDIAAALGIDVNRVRVQLLDSNKQPLGRVVHHTMALPDQTRGREMHAQATSTVTAATVTVISPSSSGDMSAAAAKQSLREQMALSTSALSKGVAASQFVPPGQSHTKWKGRADNWRLCVAVRLQLLIDCLCSSILSYLLLFLSDLRVERSGVGRVLMRHQRAERHDSLRGFGRLDALEFGSVRHQASHVAIVHAHGMQPLWRRRRRHDGWRRWWRRRRWFNWRWRRPHILQQLNWSGIWGRRRHGRRRWWRRRWRRRRGRLRPEFRFFFVRTAAAVDRRGSWRRRGAHRPHHRARLLLLRQAAPQSHQAAGDDGHGSPEASARNCPSRRGCAPCGRRSAGRSLDHAWPGSCRPRAGQSEWRRLAERAECPHAHGHSRGVASCSTCRCFRPAAAAAAAARSRVKKRLPFFQTSPFTILYTYIVFLLLIHSSLTSLASCSPSLRWSVRADLGFRISSPGHYM